jgi:hypothetical protein
VKCANFAILSTHGPNFHIIAESSQKAVAQHRHSLRCMDVGGTNLYSSAIVSSLGPIHGSFSGAQTDGLSSLQQSAEGLVSSDYLDSFKQGKVRLHWEWLRVHTAHGRLGLASSPSHVAFLRSLASLTPSANSANVGLRKSTSASLRLSKLTAGSGGRLKVSSIS